MTSKTAPRIPLIGESVRLCGKLVEVQDVTPPVTQVLDYIFAEESATVLVKANGVILTESGTFNDFYGPPEKPAFVEAIKLAQKLGDGVEVVVVKKTEFVRKRPTGNANFYAKDFCEFENLKNGCRWNVPEDITEQVWSSKDGAK